jgi:hypothetical protein
VKGVYIRRDNVTKPLLQGMMTLFGLHFHLQRKMINGSV